MQKSTLQVYILVDFWRITKSLSNIMLYYFYDHFHVMHSNLFLVQHKKMRQKQESLGKQKLFKILF